MLLRPENDIKLATVRITKEEGEEGKEGNVIRKSRPRRRSTLKKSKIKAAVNTFAFERRRSKRILNTQLEAQKIESDEKPAVLGNLDAFIGQSISLERAKRNNADMQESPLICKLSVSKYRKDEVLTDNE